VLGHTSSGATTPAATMIGPSEDDVTRLGVSHRLLFLYNHFTVVLFCGFIHILFYFIIIKFYPAVHIKSSYHLCSIEPDFSTNMVFK